MVSAMHFFAWWNSFLCDAKINIKKNGSFLDMLSLTEKSQLMFTIHLLIKGKVQGVFYRATARSVANRLGITGWIRNTDDGDVEAVISGNGEITQHFIDWCWQGPEKAMVTDVQVREMPEQKFSDFKVMRN